MNKTLTIALIAVLALSGLQVVLVLYIQHENDLLTYQEQTFYNEFGLLPVSNFAYPFSPPISMYQALQIGLESEGWDKTSLAGMSVRADFVYAFTETAYLSGGTTIVRMVTTPPSNYSSTSEGLAGTYEYAWAITVKNATNPSNPPFGFTLVDAQAGSLLPKPIPPNEA